MKREEQVRIALKKESLSHTISDFKDGYQGCTSSYLAKLLELDRSNISRSLNQLVADKKAIKIKGKPVHYISKEAIEIIFSFSPSKTDYPSILDLLDNVLQQPIQADCWNICGSHGSLKNAIDKAKAATLYPPNGLHTLVIGETGSGKSLFAELMYQYAKEQNYLKPHAPLCVFNCAEYKDNPQLLLSLLFGYEKGAFTGADTAKKGLLEQADGGILFLDEVHRLPPEGQEMLFYVIDKNRFRRLGGAELSSEVNVRIIAATTENPDSTLLRTFLRRIPLTIELPALQDRPLAERFLIIQSIFENESTNLNLSIKVHRKTMEMMLSYACPGNIGQLKSDIRLCCAKAYMNYRLQRLSSKQLEVSIKELPDHIYLSALNNNQHLPQFNIGKKHDKSFYEFPLHNTNYNTCLLESSDKNIYESINDKLIMYKKMGLSANHMIDRLSHFIEKYYLNNYANIPAPSDRGNSTHTLKVIDQKIYSLVRIALKNAMNAIEENTLHRLTFAIASHLDSLIQNLNCHRNQSYDPLITDLELEPYLERIGESVYQFLLQSYDPRIPKVEAKIISLIIKSILQSQTSEPIPIVLLAHGETTASSIAKLANDLFQTSICSGINIPIETTVEEALSIASKKIETLSNQKGVLLLVDMGSLTAFGDIITKKTGVLTESIDFLSTPLVLESVRKSLSREYSLPQLKNQILESLRSYLSNLINDKEIPVLENSKYLILTTCFTGKGAALKFADYITQKLPSYLKKVTDVLPITREDLQSVTRLSADYSKTILIGSIQIPEQISIPFFSIETILTSEGFGKILEYFGEKTISTASFKHSNELSIIPLLSTTLTFIDPIKILPLLNDCFFELCNDLKVTDTLRKKYQFFLHSSCLIERLMKNDSLQYSNIHKLMKANTLPFQYLKKNFAQIEDYFDIRIPDEEYGYIYDLLYEGVPIYEVSV